MMDWRDRDILRRLAARESEQQFVALLRCAQPEYHRDRAARVAAHTERIQAELKRRGMIRERRK